MTQAQKKIEQQPADHPLIRDFYKQYEEAVEQARLSSLTTDTARWQAIYHEHQRTLIRRRKELAGELATMAETLEQRGWDEDDEKAVKDTIKQAVTLREAETHWRRQTLEKITAPVEACEIIRRDALNKASSFAASQPMFGQKVQDELRRVMGMLPLVAFDEETGCVTVTDQ